MSRGSCIFEEVLNEGKYALLKLLSPSPQGKGVRGMGLIKNLYNT
jgi:hypothetical protein